MGKVFTSRWFIHPCRSWSDGSSRFKLRRKGNGCHPNSQTFSSTSKVRMAVSADVYRNLSQPLPLSCMILTPASDNALRESTMSRMSKDNLRPPTCFQRDNGERRGSVVVQTRTHEETPVCSEDGIPGRAWVEEEEESRGSRCRSSHVIVIKRDDECRTERTPRRDWLDLSVRVTGVSIVCSQSPDIGPRPIICHPAGTIIALAATCLW